MPRNRKVPPNAAKFNGDISFPVSYREQAKYLKLADDFLVLDKKPERAPVISIEAGRHVHNPKRKKSA